AIKGLGDSVVSKILENRPYTDINDFISRSGCSKSHIVQLIKAGAFGTEHKRGMLLKYFDMIVPKKEYKNVKTIPSPKEDTLKRWGIDSSKFTDPDRKKNNAMILELYNQKRKKQFDQEQAEKIRQEKQFYCDKYLQDEY